MEKPAYPFLVRMSCRSLSRGLLLIGSGVFLLSPVIAAEGDFAEIYREARERQDWTTAAEAAIRWLEADPGRTHLAGEIAKARLLEGDLEAAESWLEKWEATVPEVSAGMLALRGELAHARDKPMEARDFWLRSYERQADSTVARRLMDRRLWEPEERSEYESLMNHVVGEFQFTGAIRVAAEAAIRERDWDKVAKWAAALNEAGTRPAMKVAAHLEQAMGAKKQLLAHDDAIRDLDSGLGHARRGHFFLTLDLFQLALEDATEALARSPRMVLPKITLALCQVQWNNQAAARDLRVVIVNEQAQIPDASRLRLDRLDHEVSQDDVVPEMFLKRALVLASCGQPYLALDDLNAAGPELEDSAEGWVCRGQIHMAMREPAAAKDAFDEALARDNAHQGAWAGLAQLAMDRADYAEAIERYRWLLKRNPGNEEYKVALRLAEARRR